MYEEGVTEGNGDIVRLGQMKAIKIEGYKLSFRFHENGRISREKLLEIRHRIQMGEWEGNRTHWAVKDGDLPQEVLRLMVATPKSYDIVVSYAGEDREYVEQVAEILVERGVEVFYDKYERATLWGKDLAEHFDSIYRKQSRYCVMFISKPYAEKMWTRHERRSILARSLEQLDEYVLPVRLDKTDLPGLRPTIGYETGKPEEIADLILEKLGRKR